MDNFKCTLGVENDNENDSHSTQNRALLYNSESK